MRFEGLPDSASNTKKNRLLPDKRREKLYVQVAYLLADEETVSREFGAYSLDGGMELNMKSGVMFQSGVH